MKRGKSWIDVNKPGVGRLDSDAMDYDDSSTGKSEEAPAKKPKGKLKHENTLFNAWKSVDSSAPAVDSNSGEQELAKIERPRELETPPTAGRALSLELPSERNSRLSGLAGLGASTKKILWSRNRSLDSLRPGEEELVDEKSDGKRPRLSSNMLKQLAFEVRFTDLDDRVQKFQLLQTDNWAVLLDDIRNCLLYQPRPPLHELELLVQGKPLAFADWQKKIKDHPLYPVMRLEVSRLERPAFYEDEDLTKANIWTAMQELAEAYRKRLHREYQLREQGVALTLILKHMHKPFRAVLIRGLNAKEGEVITSRGHKYTPVQVHRLVCYAYKDYLSSSDFMKAVRDVIVNAGGVNPKLNSLRILQIWVSQFRVRDFTTFNVGNSRMLLDYENILKHFEQDEDLNVITSAKEIFKSLPSVKGLLEGRKPIDPRVRKGAAKMMTGGGGTASRAMYVYAKCLDKFGELDGGDFANNKDKHRKTNPRVMELIKFVNTTGAAVTFDVLSGLDSEERGEKIDEWIRVADALIKSKDFNSARAVVAGLTTASIYRLKKSWEKAREGPKMKNVQNILEGNNFLQQRRALEQNEKKTTMVIPFVGMVLKDLIGTDQIPKLHDNGDINWRKYHLNAKVVYRVIKQIISKSPRPVLVTAEVTRDMDDLYFEAMQHSTQELDALGDQILDTEKGALGDCCNESDRTKIILATFFHLLTLASNAYILKVHIDDEKTFYTRATIGIFIVTNFVPVMITYQTDYSVPESSFDDMDISKPTSESHFTKAHIISYCFDMLGLGVVPAAWRSLKDNRMYENMFGDLPSRKLEFIRKRAAYSLIQHLFMVVLFMYTVERHHHWGTQRNFFFLPPFLSIVYTIFHIFRGSNETIFLVSGKPIVLWGVVLILIDFALRSLSLIAVAVVLLSKGDCKDKATVGDESCYDLEYDEGEAFCAKMQDEFQARGDDLSELCCECGGGIPAETSRAMWMFFTSFWLIAVVGIELGFVAYFHRKWKQAHRVLFERRDTMVAINSPSGRGPGLMLSKQEYGAICKSFAQKLAQAMLLSLTFLSINIPFVQGMSRPEKRHWEFGFRVLVTVVAAIIYVYSFYAPEDDITGVYIIYDDITTRVIVGVSCLVPIQILAYWRFEKIFSKEDWDDQLGGLTPSSSTAFGAAWGRGASSRNSRAKYNFKGLTGAQTTTTLTTPPVSQESAQVSTEKLKPGGFAGAKLGSFGTEYGLTEKINALSGSGGTLVCPDGLLTEDDPSDPDLAGGGGGGDTADPATKLEVAELPRESKTVWEKKVPLTAPESNFVSP